MLKLFYKIILSKEFRYSKKGVTILEKSSKNIKQFTGLAGETLNEGILQMNLRNLTRNPKEQNLLREYFYLLVKTTFLKPEVYDVLIKKESYAEVTSKYGINATTLKNKIYYETKKVYKELMFDPYATVLNHTQEDGYLDVMTQHIKELTLRYEPINQTRLHDNLLLNFSDYAKVDYNYIPNVDDEHLRQFLIRLKGISKPYIEMVLSKTDDQLVGYVGYLINTPDENLTPQAREHKIQLKSVWYLNNVQ